MAKCYFVLDIDVHDSQGIAAYGARVRPLVESRGGRYLVATTKFQQPEAPWDLKMLVIIEFDSIEAAKSVYEDPVYRSEIMPLRLNAATSKMVIVQGRE